MIISKIKQINIGEQYNSLTERQQEIIQKTKKRPVIDQNFNPGKDENSYKLFWSRNLINKSVWINAFTEVYNNGLYEYPEIDDFIYNGYNYRVTTSSNRYGILYITRYLDL